MNDHIKQDINFLEHPIWMQQLQKASIQIVRWKDQDGYVFEAAGGVPSKVDMLFLYFFMLESQAHNWSDTLILTRYQVLKGCGMNTGKPERNRLKQSLEIWKRVSISFNGTFYSGKEYHYMEFGIIDAWRARKKDNKLEIRLSQSWIEKIQQSEFFKYISFSQMKALRSPLAFRLYEILVKNFYQRNIWEIDALRLAAKIPMVEKYFADIVPRVTAATKRIREKTELNVKVEVVKQGRGQGKFIFTKKQKQKPTQCDFFQEQQSGFLNQIPCKLLDIIPKADRNGCIQLCQEILNRDGADGLRFYIQRTNNRKKTDAGNYGGYLKTIFDLHLYSAVLVERKAAEEKVKAEHQVHIEQLKKAQEIAHAHEKELARRAALKLMKSEQPDQYQVLRRQAADELGIDLKHLKRGEKLKVEFKMMKLRDSSSIHWF